jgi:hypothetical protein
MFNYFVKQEYCKRSGQIPAFGDWDYANELPITQYFESSRQSGREFCEGEKIWASNVAYSG